MPWELQQEAKRVADSPIRCWSRAHPSSCFLPAGADGLLSFTTLFNNYGSDWRMEKREKNWILCMCMCVCVCYNTKLRNKSFNYLSGLVNNCQLLLPHEQYYRRGILKRKKYLNAYKWKMSSRPTGKCTNINQRPELTPGARASHYFLVFLTFFPLP